MSPNKKTVLEYMEAFEVTDHERILSCLTDDVVWDMPGFFHHEGKEAFDKEIENDNFTGSPQIRVNRVIEDGDVVVAEGWVQAQIKAGGMLDTVFCDVFDMEN